METEILLFHVTGITPQLRAKVCVQWRILRSMYGKAIKMSFGFHVISY